MKKILMLMIVALAVISVKAITIEEAYNKLAEIPGAELSNVPESDCAKEGIDWGKIIMFIGVKPDTLAQVNAIIGSITDPVIIEQSSQEQNVVAYAATQKNGRTRALVNVSMPVVSNVIVYAQGGENVVSGMGIE